MNEPLHRRLGLTDDELESISALPVALQGLLGISVLGSFQATLALYVVLVLATLPLPGWAVRGGVAFAGTRAVGEAAIRRFATPPPGAASPAGS